MGGAHVREGQIWQHQKGGIYTVVGVANEYDEDMKRPLIVVYLDKDGHIWAREMPEFLDKFKYVDPETIKIVTKTE